MKKQVIYLLEIGEEQGNNVYVHNNIMFLDKVKALNYGNKHLKKHEENYFMLYQDMEKLSNTDIQAINDIGMTQEDSDIPLIMQSKGNIILYKSKLLTQRDNNNLLVEYIG